MKLGFLGLGIMGYPMARNLLRAGNSVAVWSNTRAKAQKLADEEHAEVCDTPRQVAEVADIIFMCVGDTAMSEKVALGPGGLLEGVRTGTIVGDCSTVAPSYARRAAEAFAAKGAHFLDTPVTGSKPGAEGGTLTFMIGGDRGIYEKLKPVLEPMGKQIYYCGSRPARQTDAEPDSLQSFTSL